MLTLCMRRLETRPHDPTISHSHVLDMMAESTALILSDLTQSQVITRVTPVVGKDGAEIARRIRWNTYNTRDRLVLATTWHLKEQMVIIDADRSAVDYHRFTGLWTICREAAHIGYQWAGAWWEGDVDPVLDNLWFQDAAELYRADPLALPPIGRLELPDGLVLEWLHPSVRIMKRLVYFAEECRIDWESLIIEDLMTDNEVTYLELREGRNTVALARIIRECFLPGMDGYDPRSRRPEVEFEIESLEVHPDHQGKGYGAILVREVQRLHRPVSTLDTYRRAERFWERMGFVHNQRRSSREDSNIFEWSPTTRKTRTSQTPEQA